MLRSQDQISRGVPTRFSKSGKAALSADTWRNNVWSAVELQEESGSASTVCENVSGLLVENALRAHDDDPRVPVLLIATVVKDLVTPQVLRHAV